MTRYLVGRHQRHRRVICVIYVARMKTCDSLLRNAVVIHSTVTPDLQPQKHSDYRCTLSQCGNLCRVIYFSLLRTNKQPSCSTETQNYVELRSLTVAVQQCCCFKQITNSKFKEENVFVIDHIGLLSCP